MIRETFLEAMEQKWAEYGNVGSPALRTAWSRMFEAFQSQAIRPHLPRPVIPAELGSGKTTAAKLYCAMLPDLDHPGVLVVVRTMEQADEFAREVNAWSERSCTAAYHTEAPEIADLRQVPVLVICHRAYELALDAVMVESFDRYEQRMQFRGGCRRLVIVDEALNQVYIARVQQEDIQKLLGQVHRQILKANIPAVNVLESVGRALLEAPDDVYRVISAEDLLAKTSYNVEEADAALVALWNDVRGSNRISPKLRIDVKETLTALRRHLAAYRWTEGQKNHASLIGSRLLLPPDAGQAILDATGRLNSVYTGLPEDYEVQEIPAVRDYRPVTLYIARTSGTGKRAMERSGDSIAKETLDAVLTHFGERASERRVLVVTDNNSEELVRETWAGAGFKELAVTHWRQIDGRNEWRDYDTFVALTLNWALGSIDLATYMAIRGVELDGPDLNTPPDEVRTMRETRLAGELAQAIGRIRLRKMTSPDGTCEPCDVFVRLARNSNYADPERIVVGVQRELRGAQVVDWAGLNDPMYREPVAQKAARAAVLAYAARMEPGTDIALKALRREIKVTAPTWYRIQKDQVLRDALAALDVRLTGRQGSYPARLVRGEVQHQPTDTDSALLELLANGPVLATEGIKRLGKSRKTVRQSRERLGVVSVRAGGQYYWKRSGGP